MFNSFNTQPPEGGCQESKEAVKEDDVSTHSHPKVAAMAQSLEKLTKEFQHTATRRWLL